jgi:predicted RNase H-like nuclease
MIVKVSPHLYVVKSESGKRLSKPMSKEAAKKRLGQIEYFKHRGK